MSIGSEVYLDVANNLVWVAEAASTPFSSTARKFA